MVMQDQAGRGMGQLSAPEARALIARAREAFIDLGETIERLIDGRAWLALGYDTFTAMFTREFEDITVASDMRPAVLYQMFYEGATPAEVAMAVKGIGPELAEGFRRDFDNGTPPSLANGRRRFHMQPGDEATVVSEHIRTRPGAPSVIRLEVGPTLRREYQRIATGLGCSIEELALEFVREGFSQLARSNNKTL